MVVFGPEDDPTCTALVEQLSTKLPNANTTHIHSAETIPADCDALLVLQGLRTVSDERDSAQVNAESFAAIHAVAPRFFQHGGTLVTVQDTGGDFGFSPSDNTLLRSWSGGLSGIAKSAKREWTQASVKAIDLQQYGHDPTACAAILTEELLFGGPEVEIGLRADGSRWTLASVDEPIQTEDLDLSSSDLVVVSGGARGVTAACVIELAKASNAHFVLLGRSALREEPSEFHGIDDDATLKRTAMQVFKQRGERISPRELGRFVSKLRAGREIRSTLQAIHNAGGHAVYASADVRDAQALRSAISTLPASYPTTPTALIHGAGVLADGLIHKKTTDDFDFVFNTKVLGLQALLHALDGAPLRHVLLFSSVAGRSGNTGQSDYAAANETLIRVARALQHTMPNARVRALDWGPWDGGMVTPELKRHFAAQGIEVIPIDQGARAMVREMRTPLDTPHASPNEIVLGSDFAPNDPRAVLPPGGLHTTWILDPKRHAWIDDHRVEGTPVLPMVAVLEHFIALASSLLPGSDASSWRCDNLRVLSPVKLANFPAQPAHLPITITLQDDGTLQATLSFDNTPSYQATLHHSNTPHTLAAPPALSFDHDTPDTPLYEQPSLFHGDSLRVLRSLQGLGSSCAQATLVGNAQLDWPSSNPFTDPAALDGCLQLALAWRSLKDGTLSIPLSIQSAQYASTGPVRDELRATLVAREHNSLRATVDIYLQRTSDNNTVALLQGVDLYTRPS